MIVDFLAMIGLVACYRWLCRAVFYAQTSPDRVNYFLTKDGWRLALSYYGPQKPTNCLPVILCHGIGSSALAFDVTREVSFARKLAALGHRVYVLDLRGSGASERPRWKGRRFNWSFDTHVDFDIPAAIAEVCRLEGVQQVNWIGLSLGGNLIYAYLGGDQSQLGRVVTIASSLDYSDTGSEFDIFTSAKKFIWLLPALPLGFFATLSSPLTARFGSRLDKFSFWPSNCSGRIMRKLQAHGYFAISGRVLAQVCQLFERGGLWSEDQSLNYFDRLTAVKTPVLAVSGDRDRQCPAEAVERTFGALGSLDKAHLRLGKEFGTHDHYGHMDLVLGKRIDEEILPQIESWLRAESI